MRLHSPCPMPQCHTIHSQEAVEWCGSHYSLLRHEGNCFVGQNPSILSNITKEKEKESIIQDINPNRSRIQNTISRDRERERENGGEGVV